jgi:hypothetical protein
MKQLAIPLSHQKTIAKWLVIPSELGVELTPKQSGREWPHRNLLPQREGGSEAAGHPPAYFLAGAIGWLRHNQRLGECSWLAYNQSLGHRSLVA